MKRGIDQITAWLIATALAATTYGVGYGVARLMAKSHGKHSARGHADSGHDAAGHAGGHDTHGDGHDAPKQGTGHSTAAPNSGHDAPESGDHGNLKHDAAQHHDQPASHGATGHKAEGQESDGHADGGAHDAGAKSSHAAPDQHGEGGAATHGDKPSSKGHDKSDHGEKSHGNGHDGASRTKASRGPGLVPALAGVPWDYRGSTGPEYWGELSPSYSLCKSGKRQSPIDIDKTLVGSKLLPIRWHYEPGPVEVSYGGRFLSVISGEPGNSIDVEGERYNFVRLDVHAPSEHKISGLPYDLELTLLHQDSSGNMVMINVLVEEGAANAGLEGLVGLLPMQNDRADVQMFSLEKLLPKQRTYYRYDGSLTTPPCSEGVIQMVMTRTIEASARQIDALIGLVGFNARPIQSLRGRKLLKSTR